MPTVLQRADCRRHRERLLLLLRSSPHQADNERRLRASAAPRASRRFGRMLAVLAHDNLSDGRARPAAAPCVRRRGKWRRRAKLGGVCCERDVRRSRFWLPAVSPFGLPRTGVLPARRRPPTSPRTYLPRTDERPPGSPPWRALLRRRASRRPPFARRSSCHCFDSSSQQADHECRL